MDIVFDFDGVLAEYDRWEGHDVFGKPILENIELVKELWEAGHRLKLCTTRLNPYPLGLDGKPDKVVLEGRALELIKNWLWLHDILHCFCEITGYKPYGDYYIDDRALRYGLEKDYKGTLSGINLFQILLNEV